MLYNGNSMTISKAHWNTDGENVRLSMPFSKVDAERRIVSGFATLDNIDKQADIVTTEASLKAFSKFKGNIREMHQPTAIGKMVSFKEDKYFDPETKKFYSGIYVSAYVSKGAQDAWEKVLDGTYSGFSIGGRMNKWDDAYDEKMDAPVRIIKDYDLVELSLVDNPANQFANILAIEKVDGVDTITGASADVAIENVFWDKENGIVTISEEDVAISPISGTPMQNIGFVEKNDSEKTDMIKFLVDSAKGIAISKNLQEDNMADNEIVNEPTAPVADELSVVADVAPQADAELATPIADTEKADMAEVKPVDEETAEGEEDATESSEDEAKEQVSKSDEAIAELQDTISSALSNILEVVKAQAAEIADLKKSVSHVSAQIADAEADFGNLGKRIDAVEADTAFRKSGDLGEIVQEPAMVEKSIWGGSFLKSSDLFR
jgi:hypothetical protein